ncbi:MAG: toll/interleukin-1 receptor domain-containing protein, partial [Verrucomicrobiota bacterium]
MWHSENEEGERFARAIYHWFRLPSSEGIPVYFRRCDETFVKLYDNCELNIVIPLVEPHMVASVYWRQWVSDLARFSTNGSGKRVHDLVPEGSRCSLLPVALHNTAYQMPSEVRKLNFVRHQDGTTAGDIESLLVKLTEALCLILRREVAGAQELQPIKVFLSHAKADGTDVPRKIKNYIQTATQCQTFFDENDIAYGLDFGDTIKNALMTESAGLLVIQGDHYADRPWCRKEIRDFLKPLHVNEENRENKNENKKQKPDDAVYSVMPAVVVTNFLGNKVARTIPELGHTS